MSEVRITINKSLTEKQIERIEKRFGYELIVDEEPPRFERYVYFFGHDHHDYEEGDEGYDPDDDSFSPQDCQKACEWLEKIIPRLDGKVSMYPYQWGYKY